MHFLPISAIEIPDRQRKVSAREALLELKESIAERGLLHPIVVSEAPEGSFRLLAGFRRLTAITELHAASVPLVHGDLSIPPSHVPATLLSELPPLAAALVEFEENSAREDLHWKDSTTALAHIYDLRKALNPEVRILDIATDLAKLSPSEPVATLVTKISQANIVNRNLHRPEVAGARSFDEAYRNVKKNFENRLLAELATRTIAESTVPPTIRPIRGDLFEILPTLDEDQFDILLADPPYGLEANSAFGGKVQEKHHYEDSPAHAWEIYKFILTEGFRVCKPKSHIMLFCKPDMFPRIKEFAAQMAWTPFHTPIIWQRAAGSAPWGNLGFRRCYEMIFWAVKGQRGLFRASDDILIEMASRRLRSHAAEKPVELISRLLELTTLPGERVLDPCMGTGATLLAAKALHREAIGIEKEEVYFTRAIARLEGQEEDTAPLEL